MRRPPLALQVWAAVFLPLVLLFLVTCQRDASKLSPDPVAAALPAWSLVTHGTLDLSDVDTLLNPWVLDHDGGRYSNRQPGVIAAAVPFYAVAAPFTDDFSIVPAAVAASTISAAAVATFALVLLALGARPREAATFALLAGVATGTWAVSSDALWTHGPDQLLLSAAMLAAAHGRWWWCGASLGIAELVRSHLAVVALVMGCAAAWHHRRWSPLWQVGLPAAAGLALVGAYGFVVFDVVSLGPGYSAIGYDFVQIADPTGTAAPLSEVRRWAVEVAGVVVSPDRGFLLVSPVLVPLVLALRPAWRGAPSWARAAALGGVVYMLVQLKINHFTGGANFWGYRLSLELLTLSGPLLWLAWRHVRAHQSWRRAVTALTVLSVGSQVLGALVYLPDGGVPEWRHSYVLDAMQYGYHPGWGATVVYVSLICAAAIMLWPKGRGDVSPTASVSETTAPSLTSV